MLNLSILIPHKREPENDKALKVALACLADNTSVNYELIVDTETPADPYVLLNHMAYRAAGEYIALLNSDTFVAPGWDSELLALAAPNRIVNMTLVEPGAIGVFDGNLQVNFGMRPDSFDRVAFEHYAATNQNHAGGKGFVYYGLIHRKTFLARGGFDLDRGYFPTPLDSYFWQAWENDGLEIVRAPLCYVYHLQNYSNREEQDKAVRHGG